EPLRDVPCERAHLARRIGELRIVPEHMPVILEVRPAPGGIDDHRRQLSAEPLRTDARKERCREGPRIGHAPEMVAERATATLDDDRLEAGTLDEPHAGRLSARRQNGLSATCEQSDTSARVSGLTGNDRL